MRYSRKFLGFVYISEKNLRYSIVVYHLNTTITDF